jgi:hypothetical protein
VGSAPAPAKPSGSALHSMHSAGGYEHANYSRRNWLNIIEEVTAHAESLSIVHAGVDVVHASDPHAVLTLSGGGSASSGGVNIKSASGGGSSRPWPLQWD